MVKNQAFKIREIVYGGCCTGCGVWISTGPYFRRRIRRHLADWENHNHDAVEIITSNHDEFVEAEWGDQ